MNKILRQHYRIILRSQDIKKAPLHATNEYRKRSINRMISCWKHPLLSELFDAGFSLQFKQRKWGKTTKQKIRVDVSSSFTPLSLLPLCVTFKITCEENVFIPSMHVRTEPKNFLTFKDPKNRFQGTNYARLCSLYNKPIPIRVLAPIDCLKFQHSAHITVYMYLSEFL